VPKRIGDAIGVSEVRLQQLGVFNAFVDFDSRLYVDPFLLARAAEPELRTAYPRFQRHFASVLRLLSGSKERGDRLYRRAVEMLTFRESPLIRLGYGRSGRPGSGIGVGLAQRLTRTASEIQAAGISDPVIFELVGLIEDDIGADRISDMTISIVLPDLLAYSQRLARELGTATTDVSLNDVRYRIPRSRETGAGVALVPQSLLRDLPVAEDWSDVDSVAGHNAALRQRVNQIIGETWRAARRVPKFLLRQTLLENPDLFRELIRQYTAKDAAPYDFATDPAGETSWHETALSFARANPLALELKRKTKPELMAVVRQICHHFKKLVEVNGLDIHLYDGDGKPRHERYAQRLFYGVADAYCEANDIDISPEANAGSGPVDFKFSRGSKGKINVEVKLSTNSKLASGYSKQLPRYNVADNAADSIYLIVQIAESTRSIERVQKLQLEARKLDQRAPEVIVVDGRLKPSASKL
jgi:hypothetical protein